MSENKKNTWLLEITNDMAEIPRVHELIQSVRCHHSISDDTAYSIALALDELLTNTISYGYEDARLHEIRIRLEVEGHVVAVTIEDDGSPFDPLTASEPDVQAPIEERRIGGLGIFLVRHLMDAMSYERREAMNILRIEKRIDC